ncbi:DUF6261 family protein [uncultured Parabacteroides sp.]|uniref:DUF6261 family protein n=1 Tax=uncultured Parabacteroides sp. TaxID=512312 RepID=UPI0025F1302E|nr:DUF6261 family protein [uncultured Parabacteroides sp.]
MSEITALNLGLLQQDEDFGFHNIALAEFQKCTDSKITELVNNYKAKYDLFDETMKVGGGENVLSYDVTRLDQIRDEAYVGLKRQNNVALNDFDPVNAEIARQVDIILRRNGDPTALPYLAENSAIINLVQDLEAFDNHEEEEQRPGELSLPASSPLDGVSLEGVTNRLQKIGLDRWVARLKEANEKFITFFTDRNSQQATLVTGATKAARQETDTAYRAVVKRLNALAEINGDADYLEIINEMNRLIDRQRAILATRKTLNAKAAAQKKAEEDKKEDDKKEEETTDKEKPGDGGRPSEL